MDFRFILITNLIALSRSNSSVAAIVGVQDIKIPDQSMFVLNEVVVVAVVSKYGVIEPLAVTAIYKFPNLH